MKFQRLKFWLILGALACAGSACTADTASSTGNNRAANAANSSAAATPPVNAANSSPANTATANTATAPAPALDVPYVPTHETIVDEMLRMAGVKGTDVLYDLGSGDGRIPITAAQRFGTRGVGIDLNPERIKEANANAEKAKVTDKVKFIEGNIFEQDFSEATVVTLYLLPDVNLKLRPKILAMKPGTRVVSHNYDMGDWTPEEMKTLKTPDGQTHYVYFWRVPEKK